VQYLDRLDSSSFFFGTVSMTTYSIEVPCLVNHEVQIVNENETKRNIQFVPRRFLFLSQKQKTRTMLTQTLNDLSFQSSSMREHFSALSTCDDYGEEDFYLKSYRRTEEESSTSGSSGAGSSAAGAPSSYPNTKLENRLAEFESEDMPLLRSGDRTLFVTSSNLSIELKIGKDSKNMDVVVISAVVHDTSNGKVLNVNDKKVQLLQGSYSLMTKMMKHNTALQRASNWGDAEEASHLGAYGGKIVFAANVSTSALSNKRKFGLVLDEFVSKASDFSNDFAQTSKSAESRLLRRRFLMKAYNKTML
jgi:hypothetical protein